MDIGGNAAFLELFELARHVEVRLKHAAASRDRCAETSLSSIPIPR